MFLLLYFLLHTRHIAQRLIDRQFTNLSENHKDLIVQTVPYLIDILPLVHMSRRLKANARQLLGLSTEFTENLNWANQFRPLQHGCREHLRAMGHMTEGLLAALPFSLTGAQQRVLHEIRADLREGYPMQRLLQGDVGSGKTMVAAMAALQAIANGYQVALMAPTEILAEQHWQNFLNWFAPLNIEVGWLAGKLKGRARPVQQGLSGVGGLAGESGCHTAGDRCVGQRHLLSSFCLQTPSHTQREALMNWRPSPRPKPTPKK